jgi:hypothetical protein
MIVCNACSGYGSPITVPRKFRRLSAFIEDVVKFPLRDGGWVVVVVCGLLLAALKMFPILGPLAAALWLGVYLYFTASRSADGLDALPPVADFSRGRDALSSLWSAFSAFVFATTPACWYILKRAHRLPWELVAEGGRAVTVAVSPAPAFWTTPLFKLEGFVFDAILLLLTIPVLLWLPGILLFAITGVSLADIVNPQTAVRGYARLGRASLLLLAGLVFVEVVDTLADAFIDFNWVPFDFVTNPVAEIVKLYAALIAARLYGLVLFVRGYVVEYGRPEDYLEPALGEAVPTETAVVPVDAPTRSLDPIDLPVGDGRPMEQVLTAAADDEAATGDDLAKLQQLRRERPGIELSPSAEGEEMLIERLTRVPDGTAS